MRTIFLHNKQWSHWHIKLETKTDSRIQYNQIQLPSIPQSSEWAALPGKCPKTLGITNYTPKFPEFAAYSSQNSALRQSDQIGNPRKNRASVNQCPKRQNPKFPNVSRSSSLDQPNLFGSVERKAGNLALLSWRRSRRIPFLRSRFDNLQQISSITKPPNRKPSSTSTSPNRRI